MTATPIPNPEQAYVGALLWSAPDQAAQAHAWLRADDFADPQLAAVHTLVGALAGQGVTPDPAAVLALARASGMLSTEQSIRALSEQLLELFDHRATVPASARYYATHALADTYRRRTAELAARLTQIAGHADLDELDRVRDHETAQLEHLRARLDDLQGRHTPLRSVAA